MHLISKECGDLSNVFACTQAGQLWNGSDRPTVPCAEAEMGAWDSELESAPEQQMFGIW